MLSLGVPLKGLLKAPTESSLSVILQAAARTRGSLAGEFLLSLFRFCDNMIVHFQRPSQICPMGQRNHESFTGQPIFIVATYSGISKKPLSCFSPVPLLRPLHFPARSVWQAGQTYRTLLHESPYFPNRFSFPGMAG